MVGSALALILLVMTLVLLASLFGSSGEGDGPGYTLLGGLVYLGLDGFILHHIARAMMTDRVQRG